MVPALCGSSSIQPRVTVNGNGPGSPGVAQSIKENEQAVGLGFPGVCGRFPRTAVPAAILGGPGLNWLASAGKFARRRLAGTPPATSGLWRRRFGDPHSRGFPFDDAEIEQLHFWRSENFVLGPVGATVLAFGVAANQMVFDVRPCDVLEFPFAIVIHKIGLVDATALPDCLATKTGANWSTHSTPSHSRNPTV